MKALKEALSSRKGFFKPAELPKGYTMQSEVAESECCDTNCGECDC